MMDSDVIAWRVAELEKRIKANEKAIKSLEAVKNFQLGGSAAIGVAVTYLVNWFRHK